MIVWQDAPLSAAALQHIEDAANIDCVPASDDRRRVHAALQRLANRAIHRAFDQGISAKHDVAPVRKWFGKPKPTEKAKANLAEAAYRVRGRGFWDLHRNPHTMAEWLAFHGEPKRQGRAVEDFHMMLTRELAVCFYILFREAPDASRGVPVLDAEGREKRYRGGAARFVAAFYGEVGAAIARAHIADPQGRGRERNWREPSADAMRKRLQSIVRSRAWLGASIMDCGEIFWPRLSESAI